MALRITEDITTLSTATLALGRIAELTEWLVETIRRLPVFHHPVVSYENVSLSVVLDIRDIRGRRAIVERRQKVRFHSVEAGVLRDVLWGNGNSLDGYDVEGAEVVGVRREGSKQVILLALPAQAAQGQLSTVRSTRTITGGFTHRNEYMETEVERVTERVRLSLIFPSGRAPSEVVAESSPPQAPARDLPIRLRDGRAFVSWEVSQPKPLVSYRLRWTW